MYRLAAAGQWAGTTGLAGTADHLGRLLDEDWTWGTATARQRLLHRLLVIGQLAADSERLVEAGRLAEAIANRVLSRWPGLRPLPSERPQ